MNNLFKILYRHRYDIICSIILVILFSLLFIIFPKDQTKSIINAIENKTFDIRQNLISKNKKADKDIIIVTVDDPSYEYLLEEYGDWPIPRDVYAQVLDYIQSQHPKFTAFDLLFIKSLNRVAQSDKKLISAFKKYKNTFTAINFDDYSFDLRKPPEIPAKLQSIIDFDKDKTTPLKFSNCRMIMPEIVDATENIGHINTPKSDDGFIRMIPVFINYPEYDTKTLKELKDNYYLYMTVKLAKEYLNKYENQNITELKTDKNNNLLLGNRKIPLTENAQTILNWYGPSGLNTDKTFKYVSFWQVLKSAKAKSEGKKEIIPNDLFKDKIVYIGTSVFSLSDIKTVPTSKYIPGVEIHATLLNNILDNNLIHKASDKVNIIICVFLALTIFVCVYKIRSVYLSILIYIAITGFYLYISAYIMDKYNVWIWVVIPIILSIFVYIVSFIVKYMIKSRDFEYTYKLATTDGLTELYNHRFFQEQIRKNIQNSERTKNPFSLILIDIDFFKKFNDKYGHQAGDAVLKHVAKTLKSCVRNTDFVCRYGGEEMTILLNNTNKETAVKIAQNICKTIASGKYALTPDLEVNITISLGVASYPDNGKKPEELIEYSDKCLYKAKENGRNQVGFIE